MSKNNYFQQENATPTHEIHPVWRGIGFLITILTPIISAAAAMVLINFGTGQNWDWLVSLSGKVYFSSIFYQIPVVKNVAAFLSSIEYLKALVIFFVIFVLLFSGLFAFINALLYRIFGPPRYTAVDAPAPRVKTKRYIR